MTDGEYRAWHSRIVTQYAADHAAAGNWTEVESISRAEAEIDELLPAGRSTDRMLFLTAVDEHGQQVGLVWVCLAHPRGSVDCAWIYDIEIEPTRRGHGYGRALLEATESAVRAHGVGAIMLNVFGHNDRAISLYESAGYTAVSQQMRKPLP